MRCCEDCINDQHSSHNNHDRKQKNRIIKLLYFIFLFTYGITQLVLSMIAYQKFGKQTYLFDDFMENWHQNPIIDISYQNNGSCAVGYENMFDVASPIRNLNFWWDGQKGFDLCMKREKGYSFAESYSDQPKCNQQTQQICGGTDIEFKFCAPINSTCPFNSIQLLTATQYSNLIEKEKYRLDIRLSNNLFLVGTSLGKTLPLSQIRISRESQACGSDFSDYEQLFLNDDCGFNDKRYNQINTISMDLFQLANNLPINHSNNNVSLYTRPYIIWSLECRQKNLAYRAIQVQDNFQILEGLQLGLVIISAINFGVVGCLYGFITLVRIILNKGTLMDKDNIRFFGNAMLTFKILTQLAHSIILLLAFGFAMDLSLFVDRVIHFNCSDPITLKIIKQINTKIIQLFFPYDLALFIIFILFFIVEFFSCYIYVHQSIRRKKKPIKQKEEIKGPPSTSIGYILKPSFQQNLKVENKKNEQQQQYTGKEIIKNNTNTQQNSRDMMQNNINSNNQYQSQDNQRYNSLNRDNSQLQMSSINPDNQRFNQQQPIDNSISTIINNHQQYDSRNYSNYYDAQEQQQQEFEQRQNNSVIQPNEYFSQNIENGPQYSSNFKQQSQGNFTNKLNSIDSVQSQGVQPNGLNGVRSYQTEQVQQQNPEFQSFSGQQQIRQLQSVKFQSNRPQLYEEQHIIQEENEEQYKRSEVYDITKNRTPVVKKQVHNLPTYQPRFYQEQ